MAYEINDKVVANKHLDEWSDAHGHCRCAAKGDTLVIRAVYSDSYYSVSHEYRTDGMTFTAEHSELDKHE